MSNTKLKAVSTTRHDNNYYVGVLDSIRQLGYEDPSTDTDERQRQIWEELKSGDYSLNIITGHDLKNLAPHTTKYFKFFQTRANCETGVERYYEDFYVFGRKLERIIFGMMIEDDDGNDELYVIVGNKRVRAHKMGITAGEKSLCDIVIISREGMTLVDKLTFAGKIARAGNKQENSVRDENPAEDYPHQLRNEFKLLKMRNPAAEKWSEEKKIKWGKKWMIGENPDYGHECRKSALSNIVNKAFAEDRSGIPLPTPDVEDVEKQFQKFFPGAIWDHEDSEGKVDQYFLATARKLKSALTTKWSGRIPAGSHRDTVWIVAMCGDSFNRERTSLKAITSERKAYLSKVSTYNTLPQHVFSGMPRVMRVVFIQQLSNGNSEAYEWNEQTETFEQVFEV